MRPNLWMEGRLRGLNLERLLNEARAQGIRVGRVKREENRAVWLCCRAEDFGRLRQLAKDRGYEMEGQRPVGWLRWLVRGWGRKGAVAGAVMGAALLAAAMQFVWRVEIVDAGMYAADARAYLEELGIVPGVPRFRVNLTRLREQLEWRWPKVQWVRAEWAGVGLRVILDQGVPAPDIETAGESGDIVAAEDGLLLRLTVYAGQPMAKAGDFVRAGQILIRGEEKTGQDTAGPVKARGEAVARVWISARSRLPLKETGTVPTGREQVRWVLKSPWFAFSLQDQPNFLTWDMETKSLPLAGAWAPVWLDRETYLEAALEMGRRDAEEVKAEGARAALQALNRALAGAETVDKWINFSMIEGDTILTEATAELRRDIGRFQPR